LTGSANWSKACDSRIYDDPKVVAHYSRLHYLTPCEQLLFDRYVPSNSAVLDLGVGGGRTTTYLAARAAIYVGIDSSTEMIRSCRGRFPLHDFRVGEASDLSAFPDDFFDAIVMAFNSLDYVLPEEPREQCLRECYRVLKSRGVLIFSSHNPRSVLVRPSWNRQRLEAFCERLCHRTSYLFGPLFKLARITRRGLALGQAIFATATKFSRAVGSRSFWLGEGCILDSAHGGIVTHCWTPKHVIKAVAARGFRVETYMGNDYPRKSRNFVTDWFYYVFRKPALSEKTCA